MPRPSKYSDQIAVEICQRIAEGECLPAVCRDPKMPSKRAVMTWLTLPEHQTFRTIYAAAREMQADALFEPPRDCRRLFGLSHATIANSSICA